MTKVMNDEDDVDKDDDGDNDEGDGQGADEENGGDDGNVGVDVMTRRVMMVNG